MTREQINRLSRRYILDVYFWPRDEDGPLFPAEPTDDPLRWLYDMASRRGLPHHEARAWARQQAARKRGKK